MKPPYGPVRAQMASDGALSIPPERTTRATGGAEVDLLLHLPKDELWAIEVKRALTPKPERGFHHARSDLDPARSFVVYAGEERYPIGEGIEAISAGGLADELRAGG